MTFHTYDSVKTTLQAERLEVEQQNVVSHRVVLHLQVAPTGYL